MDLLELVFAMTFLVKAIFPFVALDLTGTAVFLVTVLETTFTDDLPEAFATALAEGDLAASFAVFFKVPTFLALVFCSLRFFSYI